MTVNPVPGHAPLSMGGAQAHTHLARWAVGLASLVSVVMAVSYAIFAVAYAVGGLGATEDNWVGFVGAASLLGGLVASLTSFVMAVATRVRHERWSLLWLPLALFPTLLSVVVLAEVFWLE